MADAAPAFLDISRDVCPITFVKTKLELEELPPGALLDVRIREGEPLANVTRSVVREGHQVLARDPLGGGLFLLRIRRGG
ncbi:MAG: sulfurtransferase TusA family protein [Candidatus Sumerlaeia bacterium]|nr:sulfurtransferase TusA family protein [Candidatus Sumerlaeia bacterium]